MPEIPLTVGKPIAPGRLAEIHGLKFTTSLNAAAGFFETDTERELYRLAGTCWNALQDLLRDHAHLTQANATTAERLAQWEGDPSL